MSNNKIKWVKYESKTDEKNSTNTQFIEKDEGNNMLSPMDELQKILHWHEA